jgi:hypothetical protein
MYQCLWYNDHQDYKILLIIRKVGLDENTLGNVLGECCDLNNYLDLNCLLYRVAISKHVFS